MALKTIGIVLVEPVAVFEFGVATEIFGLDRTDDGVPAFEFRVCTVDPQTPLRTKTTTALTITATHGLDGLVGCDLVIVSATVPRADQDYPPEVLAALRAAHRQGATLLSVCSGAFMLAAAGLLDGRRCTTHWMYAETFAERYPEALLDARALYVDDGDIITSAGTAAGIDACLHLVRRELGTAVVTRIARRMVVPPQRDGGQQQFIQMPVPECTADSLAPLLSWMLANLDREHTAASLARQAVMSERTFARRFAAETGTTPHKWLIGQRVLQARSLLEETDLSIEQISERVGFNSAVVLREHFRRQIGLSPADYRRRFVAPARNVAS
ncbi:helix-turn-helix domain-containing protein [Microlunatus panaciterrae]|uniref:Transcriptional regulator GlxA family with amidase domain n=1 Tax=Microlunatus panaciterrae TaxID=400768 RepID=A0ABS2RG44_9ACTN|nr:helix-turn-helix domain-containing protein [Microlunatus panaciterrae]MBM7797984.1 transcriptional regulator GlxA family with amidase domain [Microlunatus panaciterrae]